MWDAIEANQRRSVILISLMGVILVGLGALFGHVLSPEYGLIFGPLVAVSLWGGLCVLAFYQGDQLLLLSAGAHAIEKADCPRLWNTVEEMTIAAGLPRMPKVYIVDQNAPNAFATGRSPENSVVAVTTGLLKILDRDELQGVVAHEIGHIKNQDVRFMTHASVLLGSIVLLSDAFLKYTLFSGSRRRLSRGNGKSQMAMVVVAVIAAILAPIFARLLFFACSRKREFLADASAARFTRYPDGLASALEKIAAGAGRAKDISKAVAPLYIVNPLECRATGSRALSTHPPTDQRIKILRSMGGRAGYVDYESAFRSVSGSGTRCLGLRALSGEKSMKARAASKPQKEQREELIERMSEVVNIVDRLADFLLIACACGMKMKLPPEYDKDAVTCPRCGCGHAVPTAEAAKSDEASDDGSPKDADGCANEKTSSASGPGDVPFQYRRQGQAWESFRCPCSRTMQVSPSLSARFLKCRSCGQRIEILEPEKEATELGTPAS